MLEKLNRKVPKNKYKPIEKVIGTWTSKTPDNAYERAHSIMGVKAEALDADMVEKVNHKTERITNGYKVICSGVAVKMNNPKYYQKLLKEAKKEQSD